MLSATHLSENVAEKSKLNDLDLNEMSGRCSLGLVGIFMIMDDWNSKACKDVQSSSTSKFDVTSTSDMPTSQIGSVL